MLLVLNFVKSSTASLGRSGQGPLPASGALTWRSSSTNNMPLAFESIVQLDEALLNDLLEQVNSVVSITSVSCIAFYRS
jgi:hypothetical protein